MTLIINEIGSTHTFNGWGVDICLMERGERNKAHSDWGWGERNYKDPHIVHWTFDHSHYSN